MKEGKQQQKFQIKVKTTSGDEKIFTTTNVMALNRTFSHTDLNDVIHQVAAFSASVSTVDPVLKIEQSTIPVASDNMIQVPTELLKGKALDYALAVVLDWTEPFYGKGKIRFAPEDDNYLSYDQPDPDEADEEPAAANMNHYNEWSPSRQMSIAGYLMKKFKVIVTPTGHEIANPQIKAVYKQSDFDKEAAEVTAATYEEAICLAIVYRTNGASTAIPADFEQYLTPQTV